MCQDTRSTQKISVVLLHTYDKEAENKIRETLLFTIATNNIKYIVITLTKEVKDMFDKSLRL